jgi:hypothetical protein
MSQPQKISVGSTLSRSNALRGTRLLRRYLLNRDMDETRELDNAAAPGKRRGFKGASWFIRTWRGISWGGPFPRSSAIKRRTFSLWDGEELL